MSAQRLTSVPLDPASYLSRRIRQDLSKVARVRIRLREGQPDPDLIIGALLADPNGERHAGESYVVYGGASAPGTGGVFELSALDGASGFTLTGADERDESGRAVSSAGDVNGDGYDDLFIGAPLAEPHGERGAGEAYVVYGGATGTESLVPVTAKGTNAPAFRGSTKSLASRTRYLTTSVTVRLEIP